MLELKKLDGLSPELYERVGPLVMNPAVLRQNNNYPYKTSKNFVWFLLLMEGRVTAFIPLESINARQLKLDNYYVSATGGREKQLGFLLRAILEEYGAEREILALAHKRDVDVFVKWGFFVVNELVNYSKLIFKRE